MCANSKAIDHNFYYRLGKRLALYRKLRGARLKDISALLGVTYQQYQKYEAGTSRLPVDRLVRLKAYYGLNYEAFLE